MKNFGDSISLNLLEILRGEAVKVSKFDKIKFN